MQFSRAPAALALALMLSFAPGPREAWAADSRATARLAAPWTIAQVRTAMRGLTSAALTALLLGQGVATVASHAIPHAPIFEASAAVGHHAVRVEASSDASRDGAAALAAALGPPILGVSAAFPWAKRQRRKLGLPDDADPQWALARAVWENKASLERTWGPSKGPAALGPVPQRTEFSAGAAVAAVRDFYGEIRGPNASPNAKLAIAPKKALLVLDAARAVSTDQDRRDRVVAPTVLAALSAGLLSVLPGEIYPWVTSLSLILPAPFAATFVKDLASDDVARARAVTGYLLQRAINP